ncbi:MAG: ATP-binding protein [Myxococcaceae bacterium]
MGLSIVKHLMNAMEGDVSVQSKPGVGSTFSLVFPKSPGRSAGDEKPGRAG